MKINKIKETFNDYKVEISFGQLTAIRNALAADHSDPVSDELYAELNWYLDQIPGPGESEEDLKREEEASASGMASPEAEGQPLKPRADDLVPSPEGADGDGGEGIEGDEAGMPQEMPGGEGAGGEFPEEGGEGMGGAPEPGGEGAGGPEPEGGEASEADRRLPPPPEE